MTYNMLCRLTQRIWIVVVARTVLAFQNLLVALCAALVCLIYYYKAVIYRRVGIQKFMS